jgi:hypothetical protein
VANGSMLLFMMVSDARAEERNSIGCLDARLSPRPAEIRTFNCAGAFAIF